MGSFTENGLAEVEKDGKWGYIDEKGEEVISCQYDDVGSFTENGLAAVQKGDTWSYIDTTGEEVISLPEEIVEAGRFKKVE